MTAFSRAALTRAELGFFALAVVLHAGGLAVARQARVPSFIAAEPRDPLDLVEIDDLPEAREAPRSQESEPQAAANVERRFDPEVRRDPQRRTHPSEAASAPNAGAPSTDPGPQLTAPGSDSEWGAPSDGAPWTPPGMGKTGPVYLGADMLANMGKAPAAPTQAPKAAPIDPRLPSNLINDTLRKKDQEFGLDLPAAGTVASVFKTTVEGSDAPGVSGATFIVTLGPGGTVQSVKVGSTRGGDAGTWASVAAIAKGSLSARKLALTHHYEKGAVIVVNVQSKVTMPSGSKVGAGLEFSLKQTFDLADIGAKPVRTVTAQASATPVK